jgi:hypothetical protein
MDLKNFSQCEHFWQRLYLANGAYPMFSYVFVLPKPLFSSLSYGVTHLYWPPWYFHPILLFLACLYCFLVVLGLMYTSPSFLYPLPKNCLLLSFCAVGLPPLIQPYRGVTLSRSYTPLPSSAFMACSGTAKHTTLSQSLNHLLLIFFNRNAKYAFGDPSFNPNCIY